MNAVYGDLTEVVAERLYTTLRARGVTFSAVNGKLRYQAPPGALDPTLVEAIRGHKAELLDLVIEETAQPDDPFPFPVDAFLPMVQVPASAPRPEWRCPNCRFQTWSKCDGQDWFCCNCGADALMPEEVQRE